MKTKLTHLAQLALVATVAICAFSLSPAAFAQGSLTPPGAPAPTMKTLSQVEPRTPVSVAPFTISAPGSYYLTANLTVSSGDAITLAASGVTLDLNGFTISSTALSATGYGIFINSGLRNLAILNGFIQGGVTNNGTGFYSGGGFTTGIGYSSVAPVNVLVSHVSVSGCLGSGIRLGVATGDSSIVEACTVRTMGGDGIRSYIIKSSAAVDCGGTAISGNQVSDSRGESTGNDYGVFAYRIAQNCYGSSSAGYGLLTTVAQTCTGTTSSGSYGLFANTAQNCAGAASLSGTGLRAVDIAIGCIGDSYSGIGLSAYIANSCRVDSGTTSITHKYNMP